MTPRKQRETTTTEMRTTKRISKRALNQIHQVATLMVVLVKDRLGIQVIKHETSEIEE